MKTVGKYLWVIVSFKWVKQQIGRWIGGLVGCQSEYSKCSLLLEHLETCGHECCLIGGDLLPHFPPVFHQSNDSKIFVTMTSLLATSNWITCDMPQPEIKLRKKKKVHNKIKTMWSSKSKEFYKYIEINQQKLFISLVEQVLYEYRPKHTMKPSRTSQTAVWNWFTDLIKQLISRKKQLSISETWKYQYHNVVHFANRRHHKEGQMSPPNGQWLQIFS